MHYQFPGKQQLWQGSVLGGIVAAAMTARHTDAISVRSWYQNTYSCDGGDGREGNIVFEEGCRSCNGYLVGVFFHPHSDRSPYQDPDYDLSRFIQDMPQRERDAANKTIAEYRLDEIDGRTLPVVTAVFWGGENDTLIACRPWDEVIQDGVSLVEKEMLGSDDKALEKWQADFGMPPPLAALVRNLYERRMAQPGIDVTLTEEEVQLLRDNAEDPLLHWCQHAFSGIGIFFPLHLRG